MSSNTKKATTAREALLMAAELLSKRGAWCRKYLAMDSHGDPVKAKSDLARKWCAYGAIERVSGNAQVEGVAATYLDQIIGTPVVGKWNDKQKSKRAVITALRKAAEL